MHPLTKQRKRLALTQRMLADFAQVGLSTIQRAEAGRPLRADMVQLICDFFSSRYNRQVVPQELGLVSEENEEEQESAEAANIPEKAFLEQETQTLNEQVSSIPERSQDSLARYLQRQQLDILNALAPGSTNLRVGDVVGQDGFFIPPPWEELQGITTLTNLVEYVIDALMKGQRILLLGDAGQGKTTVLKQVFTLMVDRFLGDLHHTMPFPLYIPLREFPFLTGNAIELLWKHIAEEFPLSCEDFGSLVRNNRIVFLFDGFDEIKGELTQQFINERAASKVFTYTSILSCRKSFFEFYLSMTTIQEYYPHWVELQPLALNRSLIQYITTFCQQKQRKVPHKRIATPEKIMEIIGGSQELQDLAERPLLLVMMLDLFTDPREMHEDEWSVTKLYRKYTEKWLKNESAKPDSVLKWNEKAMLVQEIAWLTYTAKSSMSSSYRLSQNVTFSQSELAAFVKNLAARYPHIKEAQLLDDLCFRTLLAVSEGDSYYFLHKTFQDYYVAKYIYERMRSREQHVDAIGQVLQEFLPFEVGTFLKQMLEAKDVSFSEKDHLVDNLLEVYQHHGGEDLRAVTMRQHASHYLALLGTRRAIQFLEQTWEQEPNKWVRRGMMVGLALYCEKPYVLEQYVKIIRDDPEAASINVGYHLVYYGDQIPESGYYDQGGERCDGTIRAIFRHLRNERHRNSWILDIVTLSTLLEQRGAEALSLHKEQLPLLREFLSANHQGTSDLFQQEKQRLEMIVEGIAL